MTYVEIPLKDPTAAEVLVRTVVSGVSRGTELSVWRGSTKSQTAVWDGNLRSYVPGTQRVKPAAPGYETVGRVEATGPGVREVNVGDLVWLDRPHAEYHLVTGEQASAGRLDSNMPVIRGTFVAATRIALTGIHDSGLVLGSTVAVIGLGVIGQLVAALACANGASRVVAHDTAHGALAQCLDERVELPGVGVADLDFGRWSKQRVDGPGVDVSIECSGTMDGLASAIRATRLGGVVVCVSTYRVQAAIDLGAEFHRNRLTLISSMGYRGNPSRLHPSWDFDRLQRTSIELLARGVVEPERLVGPQFQFLDLASAYAALEDEAGENLRSVVWYD